MNTTAAALEAHVTVATIRTWARTGVIAATKAAGRWVIDTASLAHRIAIGVMRSTRRPEAPAMIDLTATYTYTHAGDSEPTTTSLTVKSSARRGTTSVTGLSALFADHLDRIADEGDRLHTAHVLDTHRIVFGSPDGSPDGYDSLSTLTSADSGRITTTYSGSPALPIETVIDIARRLADQLGA